VSPGAPIALWAVPRSRSTAFERMMAERGDLEVVHEPFSYLLVSGAFAVGEATATSLTGVLDLLLERNATRRLFLKETTDYPYDPLLADARLGRDVINTFLIRDPDAVVASYYAMKPEMTLDEVGFDRLHRLFLTAMDGTGAPPLVVDADDLVRNPGAVVEAYCQRVGLEFDAAALEWSAGSRPEWGLTDDWHRDVSRSTGFVDSRRSYAAHPANDAWLAEVAAYHRPFYEELHAHRLRLAPDPA
jgi:Sulfotransferase domain